MQRRVIRHAFTLMETMVAATILAGAVAASMGIVSTARATLLKAENRWARQHILAQATEYYLLAGLNADQPDGLLPDGYTASCEVYAVEDGIEEEAIEAIRGWILCEYHVVVYDREGIAMAETRVQKVLKEEDLE